MFQEDKFLEELNKEKQRVEEALQLFLPPRDAFPPVIHEGMHYAIYNGGKRLRPILVLQGAKLAGGNEEDVMAAACAMEMIHSYSLVHDDLPAMDDDDFRRGKPTCHRVFGEANAILVGDALLTAAFEVFCQARVPAANIVKAIGELARAAGSQGMVGGQVLDIAYAGQDISYEELSSMEGLKTGQLFLASLRTGAILCAMEEEKLQALSSYAQSFGLAFQITDDILDVCGDEISLGKPIGSDQRNSKTTSVSLLGLEEARLRAHKNVEQCLEALQVFGSEADFLRNLALYLIHRRS